MHPIEITSDSFRYHPSASTLKTDPPHLSDRHNTDIMRKVTPIGVVTLAMI